MLLNLYIAYQLFLVLLRNETVFVERNYTAIGFSEENNKSMAHAFVNPVRTSQKVICLFP